MSMRRQMLTGLALGAIVLGAGNLLRAQEEPRFRPDLEQMRETVCERLEAVADKLGLSDEQKTKVREAHTAYAEKYQTMRAARRELLQSELQALGDVLTPEQLARDRQGLLSRISVQLQWRGPDGSEIGLDPRDAGRTAARCAVDKLYQADC